ncbi:TolC family protein [Asticcacaulis taihuensis]|uniref:Outer membrane protein TolC n=1 Tax=Asticcacaulis taihuensis TaxID=260084 RepID=A0A1G4PSP8_9CAUL|nr:TolC family protein [Asticcacaulis taihuensis]SCW35310.1 Outer membrane protein TolC [Asticcacaulis taihuensis]
MRILFCAALSVALAAPLARAEPLTFDAALTLAQKSAPSLAAKSADVDAARSSAVSAGRLPDPKLRFGIENFPISGPPAGSFSRESMTMTTVGVTQDVPNAIKRRAERSRADADINAARASQTVEYRSVQVNTAVAWVNLYYAKAKLAALDDVAVTISSNQKTATSQLTSGGLRPSQTLAADQLMAALGDRRADLTAEVARARAELVRWTGDETADTAGTPPDFEVNPSALQAELDRNPMLGVYSAVADQADADVNLARANKYPDWGWDVTYAHRDHMWGDMVSTGVTISLPLFSKNRQDPAIQARQEQVTKARLDQEAVHRQLQAQLDADLADHIMHHDRLNRARATLVPLAQKRADLEVASYGAGTAMLSDVLDAQLALAEARVDLLSREADVAVDAVRITLTYGSDTQ